MEIKWSRQTQLFMPIQKQVSVGEIQGTTLPSSHQQRGCASTHQGYRPDEIEVEPRLPKHSDTKLLKHQQGDCNGNQQVGGCVEDGCGDGNCQGSGHHMTMHHGNVSSRRHPQKNRYDHQSCTVNRCDQKRP